MTQQVVERDENADESHMDDLDDGAGCTEIWEHLSQKRENKN